MAEANKYFEDRTFVAGERFTTADVLLGTLLADKEKELASGRFHNLMRYYKTVVNQPGFKKVDFKQVDLKKVDSKKVDLKKVDTSKPAKSSADESADLLDQLEKEQSKSRDPFSVLPAGKFNFDDFKRKFSNFPEDQSIPYFWDKFDPEHYSIWLCDYKYNDELGLVFQSCNLISGMYQRLDKMRKSAFASMCLYGEDHKSVIAGVWVWRGHDLAFKLSPDWQIDYDVYTWTKLDPNADETKKLVDTFFRREADYKGYKYNQGKIFK